MARTFSFGPNGLEKIGMNPTGSDASNVVIAAGNTAQLVDNPTYQPTLDGPSSSPAFKPPSA